MFAAFQKASESPNVLFQYSSGWNWVPVAVFSENNVTTTSNEDCNDLPDRSSKPSDFISEISPSIKQPGDWFEIPLSSDDEDRFSPRGVLEFQRISECESSLTPRDDCECDEILGISQQNKHVLHKFLYHETGPIFDSIPTSVPELSSIVTENAFHRNDIATIKENLTSCGNAEKYFLTPEGEYQDIEKTKNESPEENREIKLVETNLSDEDFVQKNIEKVTRDVDEVKMAQIPVQNTHAGVQTDAVKDDFSDTKSALQRQLADALKALEITRSNADNMRDRMRTYTSSMKQQAEDLRSSSRALSSTLDKVSEYKAKWREEKMLKEDMIRISEEQASKIEEFKAEEAKLKLFRQGYDRLSGLLQCDDQSQTAFQQLTLVSDKVRYLLDLVERLQVESAVAKKVHEVEMNERLGAHEAEKQTWNNFHKNKTENFESKINKLQFENGKLRSEITSIKNEFNEMRSLLRKTNDEGDNKESKLQKYEIRIKELECIISQNQEEFLKSISDMELSLKEKENFCQTLENEKNQLYEENTNIQNILAIQKFQVKVEQKEDKSVECNFTYNDAQIHQFADCVDSSSLRSSVNTDAERFQDLQNQNSQLREQIIEMREIIDFRKRELLLKDDEYARIYSDFRHLKWLFHQQEINVQHLRADNASLNHSVTMLQNNDDCQRSGHSTSSSDEKSLTGNNDSPRLRQKGGLFWSFEKPDSESDTDRIKLQTIPESADENFSDNEEANGEHLQHSVAQPSNLMGNLESEFTRTNPLNFNKTNSEPEDNTANKFKTSTPVRKRTSLSRPARDHIPSSSSSSCSDSQTNLRRPPKYKRTKNGYKLPIWRQENPENKYSCGTTRNGISQLATNSGSEVEEVFGMCRDSSFSKLNSHTSSTCSRKSKNSTLTSLQIDKQPKRLVGIPMSEEEFQKLVGSLNIDQKPVTSSELNNVSHRNLRELSWMDDGYSSSSEDLNCRRQLSEIQNDRSTYNDSIATASDQLHANLLFPYNSVADDCSDDTLTQDNRRASISSLNENSRSQYLVKYKGVTFDVSSFDITKMRQIAWDVGFSDSQAEMIKFIDFLAKVAQDLDDNPKWTGKHSLGKSSDWLQLKGLFQ
uniref:putative leucine-rich repeat-containing protein DDB_G0290503 isoform X1 n=1 Tax=Styela clava TaxID=7725 RepID=UPI00193AB0E1|nr:putative leucine-rich repeat-containing protein DDB_G0290503 isoform X1 [Styela clava]